MKKTIYILASFFLTGALISQTLTTANDPVAGDKFTKVTYDTVGTIPRNSGQNQTWNFSSMIQSTAVSTTSFIAYSAVPISATQFSAATVVEDDGSGSYTFYKTTSTPTTQTEMIGYSDGTVTQTFTNTLIQTIWPFSYGSTFTDAFGGTITGTNVSGSFNGTNTTTGSGTGTIMLPGGINMSNILQARINSVIKMSATYSSIPLSFTINSTSYNYFHTSKKFQIASVSINITESAFGNDTTITVNLNKDVAMGLTEKNFDAPFAIYPNPAKNDFTVKLTNKDAQPCRLLVFDCTGNVVKAYDYGTSVNIQDKIEIKDLPRGVYLVKTSLGDKLSVRRLIID